MNTDKKLLALSLLALCLGACTASVTGGNSPPSAIQAQFMDPRPMIQGPTVDGHWISACNPKPNANMYRVFDVTFSAGTVVRNELDFADPNCASTPNIVSYHGYFRFIDKFASGNYNVEYAFDVGKGITTFPQEDILVVGNELFLSDFIAGELANVLTNEPLYLNGAIPAPAPTNNKPAVAVSSYANAKYAFCSTQGYGVMLDFSGTDLTTSGTGTARLGTKVCGTPNEIKWNAQPQNFTVTVTGGIPQINFTDSSYGSYIHPSSSQPGLAGYSGAFSVMQGNSGECFFLSNDGTQNLDFNYACN